MDPALSLIISILLILLLIRLRISISISILCGATLLGILTIGQEVFYHMINTSASLETLRLVALVLAAFTLGYSMEYFQLLEDLTAAASRMAGKMSIPILPSVVGFLPMPGGALLSAVMLKKPVNLYNIPGDVATYINYWFRHFWIPIWPLYPSFIIAAAVVEAEYTQFILSTYPITLGAIVGGILFTRIGKLGNPTVNKQDLKIVIKSIYPILLVAFLTLLFKIDLLYTILLSLAILYIQNRASPGDIGKILRKTIDYKIIILIFAVMIYKDLIVATGAAEVFFGHLQTYNFPPFAAAFLLSFIVGFATGIELSYASVAMPMLTMFTGTAAGLVPQNLMLVFGAGFLGVMMSPLHLCLVLTADYFNAGLNSVYRYLAPVFATCFLFIVVFFILYNL
ncbi:MAG: DUF401 family protein [Archaeoglobaceae archaeon]